jgi:membrane protein implicated in regulation of membrane protease activity
MGRVRAPGVRIRPFAHSRRPRKIADVASTVGYHGGMGSVGVLHSWEWWLLAAVLLLLGEAATNALVFLMPFGGATAAAVLAAAGVPWWGQLPAFVVVTLGLIAFVRPLAVRRQAGPGLRTGAAALVGEQALVTARVDALRGQIRLDGQIWSARALDPDHIFEPGEAVHVAAIDGATAVVV